MTTYFQNKFRNETIRLQNWNYRWDGSYFITICTKNREHFFGEIVNGKMNLSNIGVLADIFWHEIKNHSKNIKLDAFVVMPNHIHAILILNGGYIDDEMNTDPGEINDGDNGFGNISVENGNCPDGGGMADIGKNSVSSIIGSYKSAVTKHARRLGYTFEWQRLYYDHLIQNENSYYHISNYIKNNVKKWDEDRFYSE